MDHRAAEPPISREEGAILHLFIESTPKLRRIEAEHIGGEAYRIKMIPWGETDAEARIIEGPGPLLF